MTSSVLSSATLHRIKVQYSKEVLKTKHYNYFVFGHHHLPMTLEVRKDSEYVHLGDWVSYFIDGFLMEKK